MEKVEKLVGKITGTTSDNDKASKMKKKTKPGKKSKNTASINEKRKPKASISENSISPPSKRPPTKGKKTTEDEKKEVDKKKGTSIPEETKAGTNKELIPAINEKPKRFHEMIHITRPRKLKWSSAAIAAVTEFVQNCVEKGSNAKEDYKSLPQRAEGSTAHGFEGNPVKNRNKDISCLDATRVKLTDNKNDYIHANWVKDKLFDRVYIAAQSPMDNTVEEFWKMSFEHSASMIIMLCDWVEDCESACAIHFPTCVGSHKNFGQMFVMCKAIEDFPKENTKQYTLEVLPEGCSNSLVTRLVHYKDWPPNCIPRTIKSLLRLMKIVSKVDSMSQGPVIVHGSKGVGRVGTFILIDTLILRLFKGERTDDNSNLQPRSTLEWLRSQRAHAVQTEEQYLFAIQSVFQYFKIMFPERFSSQNLDFDVVTPNTCLSPS